MDLALRTDGNMLERVMLSLTKRDILLMNLCLNDSGGGSHWTSYRKTASRGSRRKSQGRKHTW